MTFEELKEIVLNTLSCDADKVTLTADLMEDLGADSLDAVELNMAIEDACCVQIPDEKIADMHTLQDMLDYVNANK